MDDHVLQRHVELELGQDLVLGQRRAAMGLETTNCVCPIEPVLACLQ